VPRREPFQYAVLRVVPRVDRGERMNAGVVLFARTAAYLEARAHLDRARLAALAPGLDPGPIERRLAGLVAIAAGAPEGGPMAALEQHGRFHWLTAPSSTMVQPSEIHTGLCEDPAAALEGLFARLVATPPAGG
jgi:hypothetical protein